MRSSGRLRSIEFQQIVAKHIDDCCIFVDGYSRGLKIIKMNVSV